MTKHGRCRETARRKLGAISGTGAPLLPLSLPLIGIGTASCARVCYTAVSTFLGLGGRLIDTATMYQNNKKIRRAIESSTVARDDFVLMTKLNTAQSIAGRGGVATSSAGARAMINTSLLELGVTFIDVVLIHGAPLPLVHAAHCPR